MPNYCVAPGCDTAGNSDHSNKTSRLSTFHFPKEETLRRIWEANVPRDDGFVATNNSVLCEGHFVDTDFKSKREDTNKYRKKKSKDIVRKQLKDGVVPSVWSSFGPCPQKKENRPIVCL